MFYKRLGIDLGTANSLVWLAGEGVVLNEPTVVAVSVEDSRVVAVGSEAKQMLGRTPVNIEASRPLKDGVIADYVITEALLRHFIQKACGRAFFFKPEVVVSVPAGVTQVEKRAVLEAASGAGAKNAYLIDGPLAAAIGAKIPITEPSGSMIVDIGGGSAEGVVISLGGIVVSESVRVAGNKIDEAVASYIRKKHILANDEQTAERVKIKIGSATKLSKEEKMEVKGRDYLGGLPRTIEVLSSEVTEAIQRPLSQIIGMVKRVLEEVPPELSSDIIEKGIFMAGGTSLLRNFDKLMIQKTGVPCQIAEEPLLCAVKGTGVVAENFDLYKKSVMKK